MRAGRGRRAGGPVRVLQVGPKVAGADSRGGIATVMTHILRHDEPGIVQRHIPTFGEGSRGQKLALGVRGLSHAMVAVVRGDVDVVHAHMSFKGSVLRKGLLLQTARLAGVPSVLHCHSHGFTRWYDGLSAPARFAVRHVLYADRWLVLGERWAGEYAERLGLDPRRVEVLHNPTVPPVAVGEADPGWPGRDDAGLRMLFLGRLGERKGCYDLVAALAALPPEIQGDVAVVMAGDGDVDGVREAARRAGVESLLTFPGWIDERERAALLSSADVLLLPSHQEGLPMAVLEGMAAGRAVVTTPVGGLPEVVRDGENGLFHEPGDAEALAAAISRLHVDPELRRRLGDEARRTAAAFDIGAWHARLTRIWLELAGRAPRSAAG